MFLPLASLAFSMDLIDFAAETSMASNHMSLSGKHLLAMGPRHFHKEISAMTMKKRKISH
jgi:hypothetical protein